MIVDEILMKLGRRQHERMGIELPDSNSVEQSKLDTHGTMSHLIQNEYEIYICTTHKKQVYMCFHQTWKGSDLLLRAFNLNITLGNSNSSVPFFSWGIWSMMDLGYCLKHKPKIPVALRTSIIVNKRTIKYSVARIIEPYIAAHNCQWWKILTILPFNIQCFYLYCI